MKPIINETTEEAVKLLETGSLAFDMLVCKGRFIKTENKIIKTRNILIIIIKKTLFFKVPSLDTQRLSRFSKQVRRFFGRSCFKEFSTAEITLK